MSAEIAFALNSGGTFLIAVDYCGTRMNETK